MPNDKEQNLNPEEEPEEKKYSFLQETIKSKPISRQQLTRQLIRMAVYGVILGAFACLGFFALKPWIQDVFRGDLETVSIPEDEEPQEEQTSDEEIQEPAVVLDASSYEQMMESMNERAQEARKGIAYIEPVAASENWNARLTGISEGVTGVITADNGQELLILADNSVCADAREWTVTFQDSSTYTATLKKRDTNSGLAVFSVPRGAVTDATWAAIKVSVLGNSNVTKQGDVVMALGDMFGYADGMDYGIVSSTEYKDAIYDGECNVISTDIPADADGTGILFNLEGEVIGMISPTVWDDRESSVVNAYAISDMKSVIEMLANGDSVPYIGLYGTAVTNELQETQAMPAGIYVVDVDPDSPAMEAGIQSGDIICQVAGEDVTSIGTYQRAVLETETGDMVRLIGQRRGTDGYVEVNFTVTVGSKE
nr:S1C family serine protease [uncultured Mediterraneibacter sp.]